MIIYNGEPFELKYGGRLTEVRFFTFLPAGEFIIGLPATGSPKLLTLSEYKKVIANSIGISEPYIYTHYGAIAFSDIDDIELADNALLLKSKGVKYRVNTPFYIELFQALRDRKKIVNYIEIFIKEITGGNNGNART